MTAQLRSFPFLSPAEFTIACRSFEARYLDFLSPRRERGTGVDHDDGRQLEHQREYDITVALDGWADVRVEVRDGQVGLVVLKYIDVDVDVDADVPNENYTVPTTPTSMGEVEREKDNEIEDDDPESLVRQPAHPKSKHGRLDIEYSVLLSPTYQVPVLYFSLRNHAATTGGLNAVYNHLVPTQFKTELQDVGVMGGISVGNHPISDIPTFFVHPCNTADALRDVADPTHTSNTDTYLLLWLGLVGRCVNLQIPSALVAETGGR